MLLDKSYVWISLWSVETYTALKLMLLLEMFMNGGASRIEYRVLL